MTKEELIAQLKELRDDLLVELAKCNAKHDALLPEIAKLNSLITKE